MMRCRQEDMENVLQQKPHLKSAPLDVVEDPEGQGPVAVDEIADVMEEEGEARAVHQAHVNLQPERRLPAQGLFCVTAMHVPGDVFSSCAEGFEEQSWQSGRSEIL